LFPAFSTLDGANDHRGVQTLLAKTIKLMAFLMGAVVIGLIFAAHDVVLVFLGRDYVEPSTIVLQILCLGFWVNALAMAPHATLQACNRPDLTAKLHALETPLHLIVLFIFASTMGVVGVATAWLIRASLDCLALMWLTKRLGRLQTTDLQDQGVYSLSVLVALLSCAGLLYSRAIQTDWFGSLAGCVVVLVFLGAGWIFHLSDDERTQVMRLLRLKGRS
jgi:O-antigen/teichoic acid export membrane protein